MNDQVGGQAPEASIESRVEAALFGQKAKPQTPKAPPQQLQQPDPEAEAPTPEETPQGDGDTAPQEETFEYEVEGQKYALPKALEAAVMLEKDYRQKTMEVAEQRKSFELLHQQARVATLHQEFQSEVAQELQQIQAYDAVLKQPIDWSSLSTDEAFRKKLQIDQWKDERDAIAKSVEAKHKQFKDKAESAVKDLRTKAQELISKRIPNFSEATQKAIREHALSDGYTEAELSMAELDPRHQMTLYKAQQYDLLKAKATKTVTDVKTVKTTPSNPMPQHVKDKFAFSKALSKAPPGSHQHKQLVEQRVGSLFKR